MTLSSNQNDRDLPPSSLLEETCPIPSQSRDLRWGEEDGDNLYEPAYLTTGSVGYSFDDAKMWSSAMKLPNNGSPRENPLLAQNVVPESETWSFDFDLQAPPGCMGSQSFLNFAVQSDGKPAQKLHGTYFDNPANWVLSFDDGPIGGQGIVTQPLHQKVENYGAIVCNECSLHFADDSALDFHTRQTQHGPHACICGVTFTRVDDVDRHLQTFNPKTLYPCSYCNKHTGPNSFKRQDHLSQHLRGYHNIDVSVKSPDHGKRKPPKKPKASKLSCPHVDCPYHLDTPTLDRENMRKYFDSRKDFTEHLREIHDESPYSCDLPRCGRIRGRGFFRRRDLLKHQKYHDRD